MKGLLFAYAATLLAMLALDALWLGVIAMDLYRQGIGHLMADTPRLGAVGLFYALYPLGLVVFVVLPSTSGWRGPAALGALFGLVAYGTYDLTNLATLRGWPVALSALDMAWGCAISGASAVAGRWALRTAAKR